MVTGVPLVAVRRGLVSRHGEEVERTWLVVAAVRPPEVLQLSSVVGRTV